MPLGSHKLDMTSMVDAAARRAVVHETNGITRCFLSEAKGEGQPARLKMEGINLQVGAVTTGVDTNFVSQGTPGPATPRIKLILWKTTGPGHELRAIGSRTNVSVYPYQR